MPEFKRQHFLPSAYLKYFSTDQECCISTSLIWRFDTKTTREVVVKSQCVKDYFYSKTRAAEIESMFSINETAYCKCVDAIRAGRELQGREPGDLLLAMFDFYLRNDAHKNRTGKEGVEAYNRRVDIFCDQILLCKDSGAIQQSEVREHIQSYWRVIVLPAPLNHQFLTSDHPSMWRTLGKVVPGLKTKLHLMALPLTPYYVAIAYDNRILEITANQATSLDVGNLNFNQVQNAERCVYMSRQLPPEQLKKFQNFFANKPSSSCETNEEGWQIAWIPLPHQNHFSFMALKALVL